VDNEMQVCELQRLDDASALADVAHALEARGIGADVWPLRRTRFIPWASRTWRLMVRCADVVSARWVAAAEGVDTWPDAALRDEEQAREES
jgi:hypothetical protein